MSREEALNGFEAALPWEEDILIFYLLEKKWRIWDYLIGITATLFFLAEACVLIIGRTVWPLSKEAYLQHVVLFGILFLWEFLCSPINKLVHGKKVVYCGITESRVCYATTGLFRNQIFYDYSFEGATAYMVPLDAPESEPRKIRFSCADNDGYERGITYAYQITVPNGREGQRILDIVKKANMYEE